MGAAQGSTSPKKGRVSKKFKETVKDTGSEPQADSASQIPCFEIPIDQIIPNPNQPRKNFDPNRLKELARSIQIHGVLSPIHVHESNGNDCYELISGERRLRAAKLAGLKTIPALIRDDNHSLELAILENLQRENLNPIEEAEALKQLKELKRYTDEKIAEMLGISRTSVSELLSILRLPEAILCECRYTDNVSKTLLYHIVTITDDQKRLATWEAFKKGEIHTTQTRNFKKHNQGRRKNVQYVHKEPGYKLTIDFKKSHVEPEEITEILEAELERIARKMTGEDKM